jgi:hypothetical protein
MELGRSTRQIVNETSKKVIEAYKDEYNEEWKTEALHSISNEVDKAEAHLKYWKEIKKKIMIAK